MALSENTEIIKLDAFQIIGIGIRTSNEGGKSAQDIGELWQRFFTNKLTKKIPNKEGDEIYAIYTDYTSDFQDEYTCIVGCKVFALENIPPDMIGRKFQGGNYRKFTAQGKLPDAVASTWRNIWKQDKSLKRSYTVDYEIYDQRSVDFDNGEVDILIAVE